MRPLLLSLGTFCLVLGAVWAQNSSDGGTGPQLPVGQTFKQFVYPDYEDGKLKATLYASEATGITLNRAETTELKIQVYDNGAVTTTITSPEADLYVAERKMRTKNTVLIDRADLTAASQDCDFDLKTKKFVLRNNVRVVLKHFNLSMSPGTGTDAASTPAPAGAPPRPALNDSSLLTSPGSVGDTNSAPIPPSIPDTK